MSSNIHHFFVVKIVKILFVTFEIMYCIVTIYSHLSVPSTPEFPTPLCTSVPPAMFPKELLLLMSVKCFVIDRSVHQEIKRKHGR